MNFGPGFFKLDSINVSILSDPNPSVDSFVVSVTCSPQEAFQLLMMHSLTGRIISLVPNYETADELPDVSKKED